MSHQTRLIQADGTPNYGIFSEPVAEINYLDFDYRTPLDRPLGRIQKYLKLNKFQFLGFLSSQIVIGCAIVDLKVLSHAFFYIYHPLSQTLKEYSFILPGIATSFPLTPSEGTTTFRSFRNTIKMTSTSEPRQRRIELKLGSGESLKATLSEAEPLFQPMSICTRAGYDGWVYTQKGAGLPVEGTLEWEQGTLDLKQAGVMGSYDWSCGFMRRDTFWNWGCFSGRLNSGKSIGLNIAAGVNETGFTENVFWHEGKPTKIDTVHFDFNRYRPTDEWKLRSFDKKLELVFKPEGCRAEKIGLGVIATNFRQFFGKYYGILKTNSNVKIELEGLYGFVEDHYARW
ncbi:DUF2804 domain-containing protein [Deltaproteobacteria bacterium TL4]